MEPDPVLVSNTREWLLRAKPIPLRMRDDRRQADGLQFGENLIDALEKGELKELHQQVVQTVARKASRLARGPSNVLSREMEVTDTMDL